MCSYLIYDVIGKIKGTQLARARRFLKHQKFWNESFSANLTNNCQPINVRNHILVLATSNSVWMHRLFSEKAEILRQLSAIDKSLKDIQFIASTPLAIKQLRLEHQPLADPAVQQLKQAKAKPQTIEEALALILEKDKQLKAARANQGWQNCQQCDRLFQGKSEFCLDCQNNLQSLEEAKVLRYLREVPWMQYEAHKTELKVSRRVFIGLKELLKSETKEKLIAIAFGSDHGLKKSQINKMIRDYVSFKTGLSPKDMTEVLVRQTLGKRFASRLLDNKG